MPRATTTAAATDTIIRDPAWRKRDPDGALRVTPADAERLGLTDGRRARLTTPRGSAAVLVEVHDRMPPGHISLPDGLGVDHPDGAVRAVVTGVAPNELTSSDHRDPWAGTPHHKHVAARLEALADVSDGAAEAGSAVEAVA